MINTQYHCLKQAGNQKQEIKNKFKSESNLFLRLTWNLEHGT
jgi:hypothetical protein